MKHHDDKQQAEMSAATRSLCEVFTALKSPDEVNRFLIDLCTPAELEALTDRWRVLLLLQEGLSYRDIHERTGVSVTTVGRVARYFEMGAGGYRKALARIGKLST